MTEHDDEPIRGLPGVPPRGETILWQGAPDWRRLARTAFHLPAVAAYFAILSAVALGDAAWRGIGTPSDLAGVGATLLVGALGIGLLALLAWATARNSVYTLTDRRIVLRIGIALPKCINLPLATIGSVGLASHGDGSGDLPLTLSAAHRLDYLALWPHARPWRIARPQPMLRAVPDADAVAAVIASACRAAATPHRAVATLTTAASPTAISPATGTPPRIGAAQAA